VLQVAGELGELVQVLYQWVGHTGPIGLLQGQVAECVLFNTFTVLVGGGVPIAPDVERVPCQDSDVGP
jgi:hypothetical protein